MLQKKVCLLGATGVGKTSLIKQYVEGQFSEKYLTTLGVKVDKKVVSLNDIDIQLMIWDLEGIDRYCGFQPRYLRGASAYVIVVDRSRSQSLVEGMEIHRMAQQATDAPAIMVTNKADLTTTWHWTPEELDGYEKEFSHSFSTSAKTGQQVDALFNCLARLTL